MTLTRRTPLRRTRMRRVGPKGRARQKRLETLRPMIETRANGRCENPFCRKAARLDLDHIDKRSQGGPDTPENIVALDRGCHRRRDLAVTSPRYLGVERFQDDLGRWFACFIEGSLVQCVPLTVPKEINLTDSTRDGL